VNRAFGAKGQRPRHPLADCRLWKTDQGIQQSIIFPICEAIMSNLSCVVGLAVVVGGNHAGRSPGLVGQGALTLA
uniref:Uncharacterized protein n=1 Tax=Romanomermis culicivorax TaxID=13658 RepID=A0A915I672_ROMCU